MYLVDSGAIPIWKNPELRSMVEIKFGTRLVKDSVSSCKSGEVYLKCCTCELRYLKSQQNLKNDRLSSFDPGT